MACCEWWRRHAFAKSLYGYLKHVMVFSFATFFTYFIQLNLYRIAFFSFRRRSKMYTRVWLTTAWPSSVETLLETYRIRPDVAEKASRNPGNSCTHRHTKYYRWPSKLLSVSLWLSSASPVSCPYLVKRFRQLHFSDKQNSQTVKPQIQKFSALT